MSAPDRAPFETLPVIPLRDKVVFPHVMIPFDVGRKASVGALRHAIAHRTGIFLATQRDKNKEQPTGRDLFPTGCIAVIVQHLALDNGQVRVLIEGRRRGRIRSVRDDEFLMATVEPLDEPSEAADAEDDEEVAALLRKAQTLFGQYAKLHPNPPTDAAATQLKSDDPSRLADGIAAHMSCSVDDKQAVLERLDPLARLRDVVKLLETEIEKFQIDRKIASRVKKQMDRAQREYYLNEKIKAIHKELGRKDDRAGEIEGLRKKIDDAHMPAEARDKALEELRRLELMPPVSAEATVSRNYLQWLIDVPWHKKSRTVRDVARAEAVLEEDHHGLEKVKERILEYLAVRALLRQQKPQRAMKGTILCFVGPPGVGKTSLARSIARATGREYVRLSLGGIRDEAEIRGHRRTYIGAFPGQIIQMMKKAGTVNPVFLLDEIDKVGMDFRGDPTAALLEVLDPEQNHAFLDHYLDVPYDLTQVMFIATANVLHPVAPPLQDRLEIIHIPSYTHVEKVQIARRFLLPRARESHGLAERNLALSDDALGALIEQYTREAGVRNLEREIGSVCRKVARRVSKEGRELELHVGPDELAVLLGPPRYKKGPAAEEAEIGAATGLAWTEVGGQILIVECSLMPGKGRLILTGKLGEVMQESAQAALSFVRSSAKELRLDPEFHRCYDIHIHLPEGAIPKDGPSAGVTLATALVSRLTRRPIRSDVAMTGEMTLRGKILPVGGIREKVLAAYRAGIRTIVLPRDNERDLEEIAPEIKSALTVHLVAHMDELFPIVLLPELGAGLDAAVSPAPDDLAVVDLPPTSPVPPGGLVGEQPSGSVPQ